MTSKWETQNPFLKSWTFWDINETHSGDISYTRWWFHKYCLFPLGMWKWSNLTHICVSSWITASALLVGRWAMFISLCLFGLIRTSWNVYQLKKHLHTWKRILLSQPCIHFKVISNPFSSYITMDSYLPCPNGTSSSTCLLGGGTSNIFSFSPHTLAFDSYFIRWVG